VCPAHGTRDRLSLVPLAVMLVLLLWWLFSRA